MNREIKFRAWNGKAMNYELTHMIAPNGKPYSVLRLEILPNEIIVANDADMEIVIQQFTGLTDKNGKEIYEGDLIGQRVELQGVLKPYQVQWNGTDAEWQIWHRMEYIDLNIYKCERLEVIGNIYENPELLK